MRCLRDTNIAFQQYHASVFAIHKTNAIEFQRKKKTNINCNETIYKLQRKTINTQYLSRTQIIIALIRAQKKARIEKKIQAI